MLFIRSIDFLGFRYLAFGEWLSTVAQDQAIWDSAAEAKCHCMLISNSESFTFESPGFQMSFGSNCTH